MGEDHYSQWQDNATFLEKILREGISILPGKKLQTHIFQLKSSSGHQRAPKAAPKSISYSIYI